MKLTRKRTEISIETHEVSIIRRVAKDEVPKCPHCGEPMHAAADAGSGEHLKQLNKVHPELEPISSVETIPGEAKS